MLNRSIFYKTFAFLLLIWIPFAFQSLGFIKFVELATYKCNGWWSIITGPFLHLNLYHIVGNTRGLLITLPLMFFLHKKRTFEVVVLGIIVPMLFTYNIGMNVIGISGLTFTLIWFLIFSGIGSKDPIRFMVSMLMIIFYSSTLLSATPDAGLKIAWQAHFAGVMVALIYSIYRYLRR